MDDDPVAACSTRPNIDVIAIPAGSGRLRVTVKVNSNLTVPGNTLTQLRFGEARTSVNELIDINGQTGRSGSFTVALPGGTTQTTFDVRRQNPGTTTVHFIAKDLCGDVQKVTGGGSNAF